MRTLVLSPDFDATLCWHDAEGCGLADERTLPLSDELRQQLEHYYSLWAELILSDDSSQVSATDWRLLDKQGFALWHRLRAELGSMYHVHFYSHEFKETFADPEEFRVMAEKFSA